MSVIDNWVEGKSRAIPTEWNGRTYKSKFEARVAQFLAEQCCTGEIQYEPRNFLLEGGVSYCPDFYIPNWRIWIEAKGNLDVKSTLKVELFAKHARSTGEEFLIILPNWAQLYAWPDDEIAIWLACSNAVWIRNKWMVYIGWNSFIGDLEK